MARTDTPVTVSSDEARQQAIRELSKSQYHYTPSTPLPSPSTATPSPTPPPHAASSFHGLTIALIVLAVFLLVVAVLLILRWIGKPRTSKKSKKASADGGKSALGRIEEVLTGAARHRRDAELAAAAGDWAQAIRERFRAVIATLDERGLLPERADRTADEAARDAGEVLPEGAEVLMAAACAFDEVEYGEYVGTEAGYAVISQVDELVRGGQSGTLQLPTAIAPTVPGGPR
jgi:hypothetical protein